jgi:hypothetical protein
MGRDRIFLLCWFALLVAVAAYAVGTGILILSGSVSEKTTWRLIAAGSAQFSAVVGLALGWMAGRRNGNGAG